MKPLESRKTLIPKPLASDLLNQYLWSMRFSSDFLNDQIYPLDWWSNEKEEGSTELKWKRGSDRGLQKHYCIKSGALKWLSLLFSEFLWIGWTLHNVQSRGVPLLFYSPSSTESAKRGENGQLVRKKKQIKKGLHSREVEEQKRERQLSEKESTAEKFRCADCALTWSLILRMRRIFSNSNLFRDKTGQKTNRNVLLLLFRKKEHQQQIQTIKRKGSREKKTIKNTKEISVKNK